MLPFPNECIHVPKGIDIVSGRIQIVYQDGVSELLVRLCETGVLGKHLPDLFYLEINVTKHLLLFVLLGDVLSLV